MDEPQLSRDPALRGNAFTDFERVIDMTFTSGAVGPQNGRMSHPTWKRRKPA
jgi:hypothetical protein